MSQGCGFKMFQVPRQFPDQLVVFSDDIIFCFGYDDGYLQGTMIQILWIKWLLLELHVLNSHGIKDG